MMWTPEQDALLLQCIAEGLSAGQAGKRLNVSRNSAMGRAFRQGLSFRNGDGRPKAAVKPKPKRTASAKAPRLVTLVMPPEPAPIQETVPRPWETRTFGECAAPVKLVGGVWWSCCAPVRDEATSYCRSHCEVFFYKAETDEKGLAKSLRRYA